MQVRRNSAFLSCYFGFAYAFLVPCLNEEESLKSIVFDSELFIKGVKA